MAFVIDASISACWAFDDETDPRAEQAMLRIDAEEVFVPAIWWFETRNALLVSERRQRITPTFTTAFLSRLRKFPIQVDSNPNEFMLLTLARENKLTVYDASYLELALRLGCGLATLDRALGSATLARGVSLF